MTKAEMKKCDFCVVCEPDGKCPYSLPSLREPYCKQAVKFMVEAMKGSRNDR